MESPPLITLQAIQIPTYRNDRIRSFALWYADNEPKLSEYFQALFRYREEGEPMPDFFEFAAIQHERQEADMLKTECSICRREHGLEVVHEAE